MSSSAWPDTISCTGCGRLLFPEKFYKVDKHQHALKSWVVFEHVAHQVSCEKIGMTLEDYFGLHVTSSTCSSSRI